MNDKLDIPVYIISLDGKYKFNFNKYFNNVNILDAVDARKLTPKHLYDNNIISPRAYNDLIHGRKDHFAFAGVGGIGLYMSYRKLFNKILNSNITSNILICEQDCIINDFKNFSKKIEILKNKNFDCAIFGAYKMHNVKNKLNKDNPETQHNNSNNILSNNDLLDKEFEKNNSNFILLHSSVWSPQGIKNFNDYLNNIIDIQLDTYISFLSNINKLNVLLEKKSTTSQSFHLSTLGNTDQCKLCDLDSNGKKVSNTIYDIIKYYCVIICIVIIILALLYTLITINK